MSIMFLTAGLALVATSFAQTVASKEPPKANPPQFIILGSDDNTMARGIEWMQGVIDDGSNLDKSKRYMSFYVNTRNGGANWETDSELAGAAYKAYKAGHEIGNHTATHPYMVAFNGDRMSQEDILKEITEARDVIHANGIPSEHHFGFRTPYLRYTDETFKVIKELGFLYDVSINASTKLQAGETHWPYTLDNGSIDGNKDNNAYGETSPISNHPGLWSIPCSRIKVHPDDLKEVETVMSAKSSNFNGYITGLDYNLWNEAELDSGQTVRALMHTLEETLAGNRAPLSIGVHSQYYFTPFPTEFPNIPQEKRRQAFIEFVKQASAKENVFFVSADMVIRYMQNPVTAAEFDPENYRRPSFTDVTAPIKISLTGTRVDEGSLSVGDFTVINHNIELTHEIDIVKGGDIFEIVNNTLKFKSAQAIGKYDITVKATSEGGSIDADFTISVDKVLSDNIDISLTSGWSPSRDVATSKVTISNENGALKLELELGPSGGTSWPYAGATRSVGTMTGVKGIEITYTADKDFNVGIGCWVTSANAGFGFNAYVPGSQTLKTVLVPIGDLTKTYSDLDPSLDPSSIYDALDFTGLYVQLAAISYGETTNITVHSLKLRAEIESGVAIKTGSAIKRTSAVAITGIARNKLSLNVARSGTYQVDIYSVNGKRLFSQKANLSVGTNSIPMKNLAKGVAIVRISGLNTSLEKKITVR